MRDQHIEIPVLDFLDDFQIMLRHFEKDLDIPTFAIDSNHFGIVQVVIGEQYRQAILLTPIANGGSGVILE